MCLLALFFVILKQSQKFFVSIRGVVHETFKKKGLYLSEI